MMIDTNIFYNPLFKTGLTDKATKVFEPDNKLLERGGRIGQ